MTGVAAPTPGEPISEPVVNAPGPSPEGNDPDPALVFCGPPAWSVSEPDEAASFSCPRSALRRSRPTANPATAAPIRNTPGRRRGESRDVVQQTTCTALVEAPRQTFSSLGGIAGQVNNVAFLTGTIGHGSQLATDIVQGPASALRLTVGVGLQLLAGVP